MEKKNEAINQIERMKKLRSYVSRNIKKFKRYRVERCIEYREELEKFINLEENPWYNRDAKIVLEYLRKYSIGEYKYESLKSVSMNLIESLDVDIKLLQEALLEN